MCLGEGEKCPNLLFPSFCWPISHYHARARGVGLGRIVEDRISARFHKVSVMIRNQGAVVKQENDQFFKQFIFSQRIKES